MRIRLTLLAAAFCVAAFAQAPAPAPEAKAAEAKKPEPPKPEPPKEKTFAEIIKDAKEIQGLFPIYRTEEKVYLEIAPAQLDKVFVLAVTCESGLGERGFYAAALCGEVPIKFHKQAKNIQVIAVNSRFPADDTTPMGRTVKRSFTNSILGLAKIESAPHPDRQSYLIDLGSLLLTDLPLFSYGLEAVFRIPYRFDAKNSYFGEIKGFEKNVEMAVSAHYAAERPPLPPLLAPGATPPPMPDPPRTVPDVRSLIVEFRYSLAELPATAGYRPRLADDRVGFFFDQVDDFNIETRHTTARRYINRWHLEKQDSTAQLSPPKKPIVFWLENTVPVKYRYAIRDGVLMWNKAFERIGFKDAVEVRQQADRSDWDPADVRYATIRWIAGVDAGFAQGPSRTNPFTGEIYDADIRFSESMVRYRRQAIITEGNPLGAEAQNLFRAPWSLKPDYTCTFASEAVADLAFGMDVLETRGIEPDSPQADEIVRSFLREIAAHEVGHTLGMRHNFRASTIHTWEQAQDASITSREGITGSVMDYIPTNIAAKGQTQGEYHQSTLGPYDYWAIEYAYKPIHGAKPEDELPELAQIASRAADPRLAYGTDEDAGGFGPEPFDMDPTANRFDLGSDPLRYYAHRIRLAQEIFANMEAKLQKPGEGYQVLRRSFFSAFGQSGMALRLAAKYVGGVYQYNDHVGDPNGRLPLQPVPANRQREALNLLKENLFAARSFRFSPQLLNKLNMDRLWDYNQPFSFGRTRFDVPIHDLVLSLQRNILDRLFHPLTLRRILDSEMKVAAPAEAFRIGELFTGVQDAIWSETKAAEAIGINSFRRSLQRAHLGKMLGLLLRDGGAPEDGRTMARHGLLALRGQLNTALTGQAKMPLETRAHLGESLARIDEALKANMQRTAF